MKEQKNTRNNLTSVLIILLIIAVGVQSYFLVKMNEKLSKNEQSSESKTIAKETPIPQKKPTNLTVQRTNQQPVTFSVSPKHHFSVANNQWDPFKEMMQMQNEMNQVFNHAFGRLGKSSNVDDFYFDSDFKLDESKDEIKISTNLPNAKADSIDVHIKNNVLEIESTGEELTEEKDSEGKVIRSEKKQEHYSRSMLLPKDIDPDSLKTEYKNGTLHISLKKKSA